MRYTGAWEWDDKVPEYLLTVCGDESVIDFATSHGDDLTEGAEVLIVKVETPIGRIPPFRAGEKVRLVKVDERHYEIIREDT